MKIFFQIIPVLIFAFITNACKKAEEPQTPPNIVWIVSEDNSKHYMSLYDTNGVNTPNIEKLAEDGLVFTHAFSNAAVCSAARSTIISGCYGPRLGTHYHRFIKKVPMPEGLKMFPAYLRQAGYYTTNNAKEDYNIDKSADVWDESSNKATWRNRESGQPFFHVYNIGVTHESRLHFTEEAMAAATLTRPDSAFVQPNHPQTGLFRYTNAFYRDKIVEMDTQVGRVMDELKRDGLLENTFVFYYGDHGGALPGSKGYLYETGLHVPMVVYTPPKYRHLAPGNPGSKIDAFVSFVDLGATVLNLAGVEIPKGMDGVPFLGMGITEKELASRDETFAYADRFDEKYDMVRSLRKGKYKYIRNYQPFYPDGLWNDYRYKQMAYVEWKQLFKNNELDEIRSRFFEPKQPEALYDVEADPFETNNLTNLPEYADKLKEMRKLLVNWEKDLPDLSFYPEFFLVKNAFDNPVGFGQNHKNDIHEYIDIANLCLSDFDTVLHDIRKSLNSDDPWKRYWGLICCSSFGERAVGLKPLIASTATGDVELINRVRAAEYLGLYAKQNPVDLMTSALYKSTDDVEALLILNSIVLMRDSGRNYLFTIQADKVNPGVMQNKLVAQRIDYINKGA